MKLSQRGLEMFRDRKARSEWTDEQAIAAVKRGDIDCFEVLVNRYQARAIHLAYGMLGCHADAKEAAQDAFVSAFDALGRYTSRASFSTWFYGIVYNKCRDRLRKRGRSPFMVALDGEEGDGLKLADLQAEDPSASAEDRELAEVIAGAVASLSAQQREAFSLYHIEGHTLKETAAQMNCQLGTVKAHIYRATRQLRKMLTRSLAEG
jgi:RNA polymerase sigma-70 factor, ECF subfamily